MNRHIAHIALVVNDYDEAIQFYTQKLGASWNCWPKVKRSIPISP